MNWQDPAEWLAFDRDHLWHPYTSMQDPLPCYPVVGAEGVELILADGRRLIDGMSSWWCAIHGYNHPALNEALHAQVQKMSHVMFGGITHPAAVKLGRRLVDMTQAPLQKVFLADSGSIAIEVAMKMALQYHFSQGRPEKQHMLTIRGGYHGDPFACMSVCDPVNGMHHLFQGILPKQHFAPRPSCAFDDAWDPADLQPLREVIAQHVDTTAAIILEPIVQGAGGMWFYHPEYLRGVRDLCDEYGVLLIADEIATGFGRSGELFAVDHAGICPDIMAVGKALTGGYMTLAATLTTDEVATGISQGEAPVLMHGPTFMGNPLACAVADASLKLLQSQDWRASVKAIEKQLRQEFLPLVDHPKVADARVLGAIGVLECADPIDLRSAQEYLVSQGVWIRPFGKLLYIMPPYIITPQDLGKLTKTMAELLDQI